MYILIISTEPSYHTELNPTGGSLDMIHRQFDNSKK